MNARRPVGWPVGWPIGQTTRWLSAWLLPLCLLVAQAGALHHELGHLQAAARAGKPASATAASESHVDTAAEPCALCLAFAPLVSVACIDIAVPALLGDLSFALSDAATPAGPAPQPPAPRSRAPPPAG